MAEPPRPAEYNVLRPLKSDEWVRTNKWIINRCLFLLELQSRKYNVFDNDITNDIHSLDVDQFLERYRQSYQFEFYRIGKEFPRHLAQAELIHLATDPFGAIPYVK